MTTASCTRCGSLIHSRVPIDTSDGKIQHVICVGCSFEWVE